MKYLNYRENIKHGNNNFPFEIYEVDKKHIRYNMILHWHHEFEIIKVYSGTLTLFIDGDEYILKEDEIILLNDGTLHSGVPNNCVYDCFLFDMRFLLSSNFVGNETIQKIINHEKNIKNLFTKKDEKSYLIISEILNTMKSKNNGYELKIIGLLYTLIGIIEEENLYKIKLKTNPTYKKRLSQFKDLITYIEKNYNKNISLDDLANYANINSHYMCEFFKEITHMTPIEYLNYYRIESACDQLLLTDYKITKIAYNCGFNDSSYFTKVFKKYKNMSPKEYVQLKSK